MFRMMIYILVRILAGHKTNSDPDLLWRLIVLVQFVEGSSKSVDDAATHRDQRCWYTRVRMVMMYVILEFVIEVRFGEASISSAFSRDETASACTRKRTKEVLSWLVVVISHVCCCPRCGVVSRLLERSYLSLPRIARGLTCQEYTRQRTTVMTSQLCCGTWVPSVIRYAQKTLRYGIRGIPQRNTRVDYVIVEQGRGLLR